MACNLMACYLSTLRSQALIDSATVTKLCVCLAFISMLDQAIELIVRWTSGCSAADFSFGNKLSDSGINKRPDGI